MVLIFGNKVTLPWWRVVPSACGSFCPVKWSERLGISTVSSIERTLGAVYILKSARVGELLSGLELAGVLGPGEVWLAPAVSSLFELGQLNHCAAFRAKGF